MSSKNKTEQFFIVQLFTKNDFSDVSLLNFKREKHMALTTKEYSTYLTSNKIESENSRELINFFIEYDNGVFVPEKCDAYEPVRDKFFNTDISGPLRWLSQPGGALFLKRTKGVKYEARIENHRFTPVWEDGILVSPKVEEPRFLGEIVLYIDLHLLKTKSSEYLFNFVLRLARIVNASYGLVSLEHEYDNCQFEISKVIEDQSLPGIFWINYFGHDYTTFFGKEKLNNVSSLSWKSNHENDFIFMISETGQYSGDRKNREIMKFLGDDNFFKPHE